MIKYFALMWRFFAGSLQGTLDQLWAYGSYFGHTGFLLGLFFKIQSFGLSLMHEERKGQNPMKKHNKSSSCDFVKASSKFFYFISNKHRLQFLTDLLRSYFVLSKTFSKFLFKPKARLLNYTENFQFLLGLHITIFHSLAYSLMKA